MTVSARLRSVTLDLTPLRESKPFRRLILGEGVSVIGTQVTAVAVSLQVYAQTGS
ncbi:MAG: MFS transporter, partial [Frankiales bacterium]|nr:MFS transporter [Frankiales bacterium]